MLVLLRCKLVTRTRNTAENATTGLHEIGRQFLDINLNTIYIYLITSPGCPLATSHLRTVPSVEPLHSTRLRWAIWMHVTRPLWPAFNITVQPIYVLSLSTYQALRLQIQTLKICTPNQHIRTQRFFAPCLALPNDVDIQTCTVWKCTCIPK